MFVIDIDGYLKLFIFSDFFIKGSFLNPIIIWRSKKSIYINIKTWKMQSAKTIYDRKSWRLRYFI